MFKQRVVLKGDKQLLKQLGNLRRRVRTRIIKAAINSAASIVLKDAKSRVPVRHGQLRRSLGKRAKAYKHAYVIVVGPRKGFKTIIDGKPVNPTQYAHLVEFGTVRNRPRPFLRPALDENAQAIVAHTQAKMREAILREAAKK